MKIKLITYLVMVFLSLCTKIATSSISESMLLYISEQKYFIFNEVLRNDSSKVIYLDSKESVLDMSKIKFMANTNRYQNLQMFYDSICDFEYKTHNLLFIEKEIRKNYKNKVYSYNSNIDELIKKSGDAIISFSNEMRFDEFSLIYFTVSLPGRKLFLIALLVIDKNGKVIRNFREQIVI